MNKFIYLYSFILIASSLISLSNTCSCMPQTFDEEYSHSNIIFYGRVVRITKHDQYSNYVFFDVLKWFKGTPVRSMIRVSTPIESSMCGFNFKTNQSYIVWIESDLNVNICSRTKLFSNAQTDYNRLRRRLMLR